MKLLQAERIAARALALPFAENSPVRIRPLGQQRACETATCRAHSADLHPACRTSVKFVGSVFWENGGREEEQIH